MRQSGLLGYFELLDWFNSSFTEEEKKIIKENFIQMGFNYNDLLEGESSMPSASAIWLLTSIAGNLINKKKVIDIGIKFLEKGESIIDQRKSFADLHFLYLHFTKAYKAKNKESKALEYSKKMIEISENVSNEFIMEYGKNEISHQGFIDYLEYLEEIEDTETFNKIEDKARKEQWRGPW